jgi:hypothetical protein
VGQESLGGALAVADRVVDPAPPSLADGIRALVDDGDLRAGRRHFERAYRAAERIRDAKAMAEAALGISGLWVHEHRTTAATALQRERLWRALYLVDRGSLLALRLRVRIAGEAAYRTGEPGAIMALLDEVRTSGDPVARAEALSVAHHCLLGPDHGAVRRELAVELVGVSFRTRRRGDLLMGLLWQTVDLFFDGDPHVGRRLGELRNMLAQRPHLAVGFVVAAIDVMLAIRAGDLDRAERLARACFERGQTAGDIDATGWYGAQLVAIRWYQGRLVEVLPMLTELVDSTTLSAVDNSSLAALAVAAATAGDRSRAVSALATLRGNALADLPRSSSWLVTLNGIVEAAHLLDDVSAAAEAYELLGPYAHLPMVGSLGVACFGSVHHALGVATLTTGDLDRAVTHLRTAVRQNLALAHWPAAIASRRRLAEALQRRGHPEDTAAADRERAAADREAIELGLAVPAAAESTLSCTRQGRKWRFTLGPRSVLVDHRIGVLHLAVLIANPGQEIDAVDLAAGLSVLGPAGRDDRSSQPVLDREAVREYRRRLAELRVEIDDLESRNEHARAAQARAERDWLTAQLAATAGLGNRVRAFPTNRERARIAVGKAIRRAVDHVGAADRVIGEHLQHALRTGTRCSYLPA